MRLMIMLQTNCYRIEWIRLVRIELDEKKIYDVLEDEKSLYCRAGHDDLMARQYIRVSN